VLTHATARSSVALHARWYISVFAIYLQVKDQCGGRTGVVVVNKSHRVGWPPSKQAWRPAGVVTQAPKLPLHCLLEDALGGKVKQGQHAAGFINVVAESLTCAVLLVLEAEGAPRHVRPELPDAKRVAGK
jgi:hypothetical protein